MKKLYDALMNKLLVHKHLIVRAEAVSPPMDEEFLRRWLEKFIFGIGMKVMMGPYVKYSHMEGNRGITGAAIIAGHIVTDTFYIVFLDKTHKFWLTKRVTQN